MQVFWRRGLIDGKTLPYYDNTVNLGQDAHEIVNLDSSLRHIMSKCSTDILKASKGMMSTFTGTKLEVSCLEVIMFTPKCPHAEIACRDTGSCTYVCCMCQRGIPSDFAWSETCD